QGTGYQCPSPVEQSLRQPSSTPKFSISTSDSWRGGHILPPQKHAATPPPQSIRQSAPIAPAARPDGASKSPPGHTYRKTCPHACPSGAASPCPDASAGPAGRQIRLTAAPARCTPS